LWICSDDENVRFYNKSRPFRFEAVWLRDENCEGIIKSAWNGGNSRNSVDRLMGKVEAYRVRLKTWSRLSFGNICRLLTQKKRGASTSRESVHGGDEPRKSIDS